jgi:hemerythrin-like domain-containing protein
MSTAKKRAARPATPAAPPMPSFETLDHTHRQMLQTLDDLARLMTLLGQPGQDKTVATLAAHACRFFNETASAHHEAEETFVFPKLIKEHNPTLLAHVRRLQQDHMWLEEDWLELEPHLQAVARGYVGEHPEFLRATLPEFDATCRDHIALEETLVYPEARRRQAALPSAASPSPG